MQKVWYDPGDRESSYRWAFDAAASGGFYAGGVLDNDKRYMAHAEHVLKRQETRVKS